VNGIYCLELKQQRPCEKETFEGREKRPQNRVLNLDELNDPFFKKVNGTLSDLVSRDSTAYLHPSKRWEYPWALQEASMPAGSSVLDAGCGGSIFPAYLSTLGLRVCAADLNPPKGLTARLGISVDYAAADLRRLPWKKEAFDFIFCISVIEHLDLHGMQAALQEMGRVLRPDGRLLLTTDYYRDRSEKLYYRGPGESFAVDWNFFDRERLYEVVMSAPGFRVGGEPDLKIDWDITRERMTRFHGYPYTTVGVVLTKQ